MKQLDDLVAMANLINKESPDIIAIQEVSPCLFGQYKHYVIYINLYSVHRSVYTKCVL